jgi:amino acid transporter
MSSAVSAQPPGGLHTEPELTSAKDQRKARALGLTSATGLVTGTVIGAGVFTMPAVLAGAGTVSLVVLAVIAVGAMVLAILFGQLARRIPDSDGGLYAYARHEFGDFAGYLTGWCYWIQAWAGNAAIVSSWVFYVDALFGIKPSGLENWGIALVGLWIPAAVNLAGIRQTAWLQNLTVVLKYLPLLFVAVVGWFFVTKANFGAFNASGGSLYSAIGIAAGVALFSFIGVETAAIIAKRVKDPRRNGHHSPAGPGVVQAHPAEHRGPALRRRALGQQGQGRTRRVRRDPPRQGRRGAPFRAASRRDPRAAGGPGVRPGPDVHPRDARPDAGPPAA